MRWIIKNTAVLLVLAILCAGSLVLTACGSSGTDATGGGEASTTVQADRTFTLSELAQYDGMNGQPAYVAVDGVVYDVSASSLWQEGVHTKCDLGAVAGQDLSLVIDKAPANMRSLLETMPVVGRLDQ